MTLFTPAERRAFAPPERLLPSEWAERYRYIPADAAEPGPYRGSRTPYIAGITDAVTEPGVEELVILKAAQVGYSTLLGNLLGYIADQEPGPTLFVMPTEDAADKLVDETFRPMIDSSPQLKSHLAGKRDDVTSAGIRFDTAAVYMAFAGSPQSLAARAIRYVFLDEIDKYKATVGKEGDPISLARKRGSTFGHRRRMVMGCTPTTPDGHIARAWENCGDRRHFHVPCPACGSFQRLVFGQLRFDMPDVRAVEDKARRADYIEAHHRAEYECVACRARIATEQRQAMLQAGRWVSVGTDGKPLAERPRATRVGFHLSALYSPWVRFDQLAAQFVRAKGHRGHMREFRNQWLGETFEEVQQSVTVDQLRSGLAEKVQAPAGVVPAWAGKVIATVDVQGDRFYYVVRAWGRGRSQRIAANEVHTFEDIDRMLLNGFWPIADAPGEFLPLSRCMMDSAYRTNEVYSFAATRPLVMPIKGSPNDRPAQVLAFSVPAKELGVTLCTIDTHFFKDAIMSARADGTWLVDDGMTDEYLRHLAAEVKKLDPKTGRSVWRPVSEGTPNHYLDCEVYQMAAAQHEQTNLLPDEATLVAQRQQQRLARQQAAQAAARDAGGLYPAQPTGNGGWLGNRGKDWLG